jgi:DNA-binding MarR family transcriptional regulator
MLVIRGHNDLTPPTIGDAAEQLHIRHNSTVELAQRGEELGLLTRERDPRDHRQMRLRLTELGSVQLEKLTREHLPRIDALAAVLERVASDENAARA